MIKLKLKLHPPKKWEKIDYVTKNDIEQYEHLIYNDLDITRKIESDIPSYDYKWVDKYLVEDEEYVQLEAPVEMYCMTSLGRVFSYRGRKQIKPMKSGSNFYITLKGKTVVYRKEFFKNDWAYSPSLIEQKYNQYGWKYFSSTK